MRELSWADEVLYQTTFIYVSATPTDVRVPAYGIGPTDPANPLDSSDPACPHDHVLSVPPGANGGEWNAHFEFNIVFPSAAGIASGRVAYSFCDLVGGLIVSAADLDGDPLTPLQPLRSEAKIQEANALGLVTIVDIGLTGIVAVRRVG